jgi:hypothetical protein
LRLFRIFIPFPSILILSFLRFFNSYTVLDSLRSLFNLPLINSENDLQRLGLSLRPLRSGMHPAGDGSTRNLLLEGNTFFTYVAKQSPKNSTLRNYVRMIKKLRGGKAICIPKPFILLPILIVIIDRSKLNTTPWSSEFFWRLNSATRLAEATTFGAQRFLGIGDSNSFSIALLRIARAVLSEALCGVLALILKPLILVLLPRKWGVVNET